MAGTTLVFDMIILGSEGRLRGLGRAGRRGLGTQQVRATYTEGAGQTFRIPSVGHCSGMAMVSPFPENLPQ